MNTPPELDSVGDLEMPVSAAGRAPCLPTGDSALVQEVLEGGRRAWRLRFPRRCLDAQSLDVDGDGSFNKFRNDRWVFGDRGNVLNDRGEIPTLLKFSWTNIVRHQLIAGGASPDDPDLTDYWVKRRRKVKPPLDSYNLRLLAKQDGRCPLCGEHLLTTDQPPQSPQEWERWWLNVVKRAIAAGYLTLHGRPDTSDGNRTRLVHASCHRGLRARNRRRPSAVALVTPSGLA
ncbi:hypothetical protein ACFYW6_38270 [Streptomyces sp. NPDC002659]|uniref:hypothetical protein n=1 Tax=Streptomyces sp. NPDC002659 TaxID=3364656 RepID=UPI0036940873